jgi:hypothetical protein
MTTVISALHHDKNQKEESVSQTKPQERRTVKSKMQHNSPASHNVQA